MKQNFGILITMLVSWGILVALAGLCYLMITWDWSMMTIFAVLLMLLAAIDVVAYRLLMKNVDKYYCAG